MIHINPYNLKTGSNTEKATAHLNFNSLVPDIPHPQTTVYPTWSPQRYHYVRVPSSV